MAEADDTDATVRMREPTASSWASQRWVVKLVVRRHRRQRRVSAIGAVPGTRARGREPNRSSQTLEWQRCYTCLSALPLQAPTRSRSLRHRLFSTTGGNHGQNARSQQRLRSRGQACRIRRHSSGSRRGPDGGARLRPDKRAGDGATRLGTRTLPALGNLPGASDTGAGHVAGGEGERLSIHLERACPAGTPGRAAGRGRRRAAGPEGIGPVQRRTRRLWSNTGSSSSARAG